MSKRVGSVRRSGRSKKLSNAKRGSSAKKALLQRTGVSRPTDPDLKNLWTIVETGTFHQLDLAKLDKLKARIDRNFLKNEDILQARCCLSFSYDYLAEFSKAESVLQEQVLPIKDELSGRSEMELWATALYATSQYRLNKPGAEKLFESCQLSAETLPTTRHNLHTMAHIAYYRGQCCRQYGRFDEALTYLTQAISFAKDFYELGVTVATEESDNSRGGAVLAKGFDHAQLALDQTQFLIGKTMIQGFGWLYFSRGQLRNARPTVMAGMIMAQKAGDRILEGFALMILGAIERAEAGSRSEAIKAALKKLHTAHDIFKNRNHRYKALAEFYLAIGYWYLGELDQAEAYAVACHERPDPQWRAKAGTLLCRITTSRFRHQKGLASLIAQAKSLAFSAIAEAEKGPFSVGIVEGKIALAEAEIAGGSRETARQYLVEALEESQKFENQKSAGACLLHLARMDADDGRLASAHQYLEAWTSLSRLIENGTLQEWAADLKRKLEDADHDFVISRNVIHLNEDTHVENLKNWLTRVSLKRYSSKTAAAAALGKSRMTVHNRTDRKD